MSVEELPRSPAREGSTCTATATSLLVLLVLELADPTRVVIDLAHPQKIDDGGLVAPRGLTVTPASGPVGTEVIVEGRGCGNLEESVRLVFQNGSTGTVGAVDLGEFPVSEQDAFRATAVVIPATMDPLQGVGGGPTRPGTYQFTTRPPACTATFTVTSTAPNGPDTPGTLPFTGSHTPQLLAIGGGLLAVGVGLFLLVRRQTNLAA
jgi:LPXTG-motif cell wall-anchored protein